MVEKRDFPVRHDSWEEVDAPAFTHIPTMISAQERRYLYWLSSKVHTGQGRIVEAGTWLGGSSAALAAGLRDAGSTEVLHCYDNFEWVTSYRNHAPGIFLRDGGDFHPHFKTFIAEAGLSNVRSTKAQLTDIVWTGEPIEILFLDAPKNRADMIASIRAFFPYLIPGRSLVVFQDFFYAPAHEVPATVCALGDALSLVHTVAGSSTAAFRVEGRAISLSEEDADYERLPLRVVIDRMRDLMQSMPTQAGDFLAVSIAMLLADKGRVDEGVEAVKARRLGAAGQSRLRYLSSLGFLRKRYGALFDGLGIV